MIYMRLENFEEYYGSSPNYTEIYELIHIFVKNNPGANLSSAVNSHNSAMESFGLMWLNGPLMGERAFCGTRCGEMLNYGHYRYALR